MYRRTKIVATLGPNADQENILSGFVERGVDVFRFNMSHGDHDTIKRRMHALRDIAKRAKKDIAIFADLQGPKMRLGRFLNDQVRFKAGDTFTLDLQMPSDGGTSSAVWMDCDGLIDSVKPGSILLLDDGKMHLQVTKVTEHAVICLVLTEGVLASRKGISIQGGGLQAQVFTKKDHDDLEVALKLGVDFIALSFPATRDDIVSLRTLIDKVDPSVGIIAKIERKEAIDNLPAIIKASDVIMVARGDLALEVGDAEVPILQKHIINTARNLAKPVIVATHMMESMIVSPTPTRAEVSDVANAILDGADAVMLSAETACGEYPLAVIDHVDAVCRRIEAHPIMQGRNIHEGLPVVSTRQAVAHMAMGLANHITIRCVVALTKTGTMPCWLSRICSGIPIYAFTHDERVGAKMLLLREVYPIILKRDITQEGGELLPIVVRVLLEQQKIKAQEHFIFMHGEGDSLAPISDMLCVHKVQSEKEYEYV